MLVEVLIVAGIMYLNWTRASPTKNSPIDDFLSLLKFYISVESIKNCYEEIQELSEKLRDAQIEEKSRSVEIFDDHDKVIIFYNIEITIAGGKCTGRLLSSGPLKIFISNNGKKIWHLNNQIPETYIWP